MAKGYRIKSSPKIEASVERFSDVTAPLFLTYNITLVDVQHSLRPLLSISQLHDSWKESLDHYWCQVPIQREADLQISTVRAWPQRYTCTPPSSSHRNPEPEHCRVINVLMWWQTEVIFKSEPHLQLESDLISVHIQLLVLYLGKYCQD